MVTPATSAQWGQTADVSEPPSTATQAATGPGVQITDSQVSGMVPAEWPAPRLWTLAAQYERLDGSTVLPRVRLAVEYGIGAAAYASEMDVPAAGMVLGVTAQSVSLSSRVLPVPLGNGGTLRVRVSATPGAPVLGAVSQVVPFGTFSPTPAAVRAIAPRGAYALVASSVPYVGAVPQVPVDATGRFIYLLPGAIAVDVSGTTAFAQPLGANSFRPLELGVSLPAAANGVSLVDAGAAGYHYLTWRVSQ